MQFLFKDDEKGARFDGDVKDNVLIWSFYNFNNSLGEGKLEPMKLGVVNKRTFYASFNLGLPPPRKEGEF
jgi:hypothetical protein